MSSELERLLRRAGEELPEPSGGATRSARERALRAVSPRRRGAPLAVAAALLVGCAVGVALGTSVVSTGQAASSGLGFGFLPEADWNVLQTGGNPSPARPGQAVAANVQLSPHDDLGGLPYSTLLSLPPRGAVIVATSLGRSEDLYELLPPLRLPLRLRDATPVPYGAQLRPGRPLAVYELHGKVDGHELSVQVYFGSERPGRAVLADAQRQLDLLVVQPKRRPADVAARALPLRQPAGGGTPVVDRTLVCTTVPSGGVHEVQLDANSGFRQGSRLQILPYARVATGEVRSVADALEDSLVWAAAGKYDHNATLTPSDEGVTNVTRFGTWALNRGQCGPSRAKVPLSARGLEAHTPDALGVTFDCVTPRRVLVRVRIVAHAVPSRYREGRFEKTKASLQQGFVAVRTQTGKPIAFASVFDSGKTRLAVARGCVEN